MEKVRTTRSQRDRLRQYPPGVGFLCYHKGNGETVECEFYVNRETGQIYYLKSGKPVEFDIVEEDEDEWD